MGMFASASNQAHLPTRNELHEILVFNRNTLEHHAFNKPHIVISIYAPYETPLDFSNSPLCKAALLICCDDYPIEYQQEPILSELLTAERPPVFFTKTHAAQIKDFIDRFHSAETTIICQCEAGLSRSPAVARALYQYLNSEPAPEDHYSTGYNNLVYQLMSEALKR